VGVERPRRGVCLYQRGAAPGRMGPLLLGGLEARCGHCYDVVLLNVAAAALGGKIVGAVGRASVCRPGWYAATAVG
jgi:hypothetical protein